MKLNARALARSSAVVMAVSYLVCALFFAIVPKEATSFFGYVFHTDLSAMGRYMTWEAFAAGLAFWPILTYVFVGVTVWLNNGIVGAGAKSETKTATDRTPTGRTLTPTA
jgi:FtsH-binding integral membrane protein